MLCSFFPKVKNNIFIPVFLLFGPHRDPRGTTDHHSQQRGGARRYAFPWLFMAGFCCGLG